MISLDFFRGLEQRRIGRALLKMSQQPSAPPISVVSEGATADASGNVVINVVVQAPSNEIDPIEKFKRSARSFINLACFLCLLGNVSIAVQIAVSAKGVVEECREVKRRYTYSEDTYYVTECFDYVDQWSRCGQGYWAGILFFFIGAYALKVARNPTKSSLEKLYACLIILSLVAVAMTCVSIQASVNVKPWKHPHLIALYITLSVLGGLSLIAICIMCFCICTVACCCGSSKTATPRPQNDIDAQTREQLTQIVRSAVAAADDQRAAETAGDQPPPYPSAPSKAAY